MKINTLSLFSGSGGFERAFLNTGYNLNIIGISEIKKHSIIVYESIFGNHKNYGDITKINEKQLPKKIDLLLHGSPCQSFSKEGKMQGAKLGSKTKSALIWETVRIIKETLPNVILWENVASAKSFLDYNEYLKTLKNLGYHNNEFILNSKDFGIPQHRRRLIVVSTLNSFEIKMPRYKVESDLKNFLDYKKKDYLYFEDRYRLTLPIYLDNKLLIRNATKKGYIEADIGNIVDLSFPNSKTRRARVIQDRTCPTILTSNVLGVITNDLRIRYLTAKENWLLMGRSDKEYLKAYTALKENKYNNIEKKLYEIGGNSIVPNIIEPIAEELKEYFKIYKSNIHYSYTNYNRKEVNI